MKTDLNQSLQEFKPTILFLVKFFGIYIIGSLLYGWYVTAYHPRPDPMTSWVTEQSAVVLNLFGLEVTTFDNQVKPTTYIASATKNIVSVYEGCNGLNVVVVFLAFLFAFGPYTKTMMWFVPLGLLVIHISNITRIVLLVLIAMQMKSYYYFTHKYLFTAFIYLFVFLLWIWWVMRLAKQKVKHDG